MVRQSRTCTWRWFSALLLLAALLLTGCGRSAPPAQSQAQSGGAAQPSRPQQAPAKPAEQPPEKLVLRLSFKIKGEFAPPFVALDKGYFKDEGLNVEVLEGSGATVVLKTLAAGNDHFGYLGAPETALGVSEGIPVLMVANYVKRMPMVLMTLAESPLKSPKDLEGKKLAVSPADSFTKFLPTFAKLNGIDEGKIEKVNMDFSAWSRALLNKQVDVISGYQTNDYHNIQQRANVKLNILPVWEHGVDFLAHGIVASKDFLTKYPETTRKVIRAMNRGFEFMKANPTEAAEILVKRFPQALDKSVVLAQIKDLGQFLESKASAGKPLGYNPPDDWKRTLDLLEQSGQLKNRKPDAQYYTNEYLPK